MDSLDLTTEPVKAQKSKQPSGWLVVYILWMAPWHIVAWHHAIYAYVHAWAMTKCRMTAERER